MSDDLRDLLRAADGGRGRPDVEAIRRRGGQLRARRRMAVASGVAAGLVAAAVAVGALAEPARIPVIGDPPPTATPSPPMPTPAPDALTPAPAPSPAVESCPPPMVRPTYLPWLDEAAPVPPPDQSFPTGPAVDPDLADPVGWVHMWLQDPTADPHAGDLPLDTATVSISRTDFGYDPYPDWPTVEVRGQQGVMVWVGDPSIAPISLSWSEGDGPCTHHTLHLHVRGQPDFLGIPGHFDENYDAYVDAVEEELVRIAASLVEAPEQPEGDVREEDRRLARVLLDFATDPTPQRHAEVPWADVVQLGLGADLHLELAASALADPDGWNIEVEDFRAYAGPFSALTLLTQAGATTLVVGDYPRCASPPETPPATLADARRISLQPVLADDASCLQWWAVDLYVRDGEVVAVTMDLFEP